MNCRDPGPPGLDKARVRTAFEGAAAGYDEVAYLQRELGRRLMEHLDPVRIEPARILDLGCGTGHALAALRRRYRGSRVVALDLAHAMVARARRAGPRVFNRPHYLCGDAEQLPLAGGVVDLVHSNAALQWCPDLDAVFAELARVLRPGGLLAFTTFGPDTLRELRGSWPRTDRSEHVHGFIDMHDIGDAMVRAGFAGVVVDVERLTVHYPDVPTLMRELKALGAANASTARPRGMTGRGVLAEVVRSYERLRRPEGLPATYEVVYAHAWRPEPGGVTVAGPARSPR